MIASLQRRIGTLRVGDPLDKNTDIGAINSAEQLARIRELSDVGEAEGAHRWQPAVRAARARLLVPADGLHRRLPRAPHRARGGLRPGAVACSPSARRTRRSPRRTTPPTASRPASGRRRARGSSRSPNQLRAGVVWANTFNKFDPTSPFGGYKQSGYGREGGRHGLTGVPEGCSALMRDRLAVRKTYKLYVNGAFPRSESGRTYEVDRRQGPLPRQRRLGLPQGRPGRRRRRPRRLRRSGRARPPTTAARCSTAWPR